MKIVLATSNEGKVLEFKEYLSDFEVISYDEIVEKFEIDECSNSFKGNALIKAEAVNNKIKKKFNNYIVLSDDSGLSVEKLNGEPGIYSSRYAGKYSNMEQNKRKLIGKLKELNLSKTPAYYTAAIAIVYKEYTFSVHGWMHGYVIDELRGNNGFGYDPMFIPLGENKTLGELPSSIKEQYSHRSKALRLALKLIKNFQ